LSWFDCTSRKVSLESSPIDSGKACNLFPVKQQKVLKFSDDYPQTIEFSNCYLACPCLPTGLSKILPAQVGWAQSRWLIQKLWTHNPSCAGRQWKVVPSNCDQPTTKQLNQTWEDPLRRDHTSSDVSGVCSPCVVQRCDILSPNAPKRSSQFQLLTAN
jgi:hypothetical protein